jgi:hypothetical protein
MMVCDLAILCITLLLMMLPSLVQLCQFYKDLIDTCVHYSKVWRFTFGIKKTLCMYIGKNTFKCTPTWNLGGVPIQNVKSLFVRVSRCRRSIFSLSSSRMRYPGPLSTTAKTLLGRQWASRHLCLDLNARVTVRDLKRLETTQGNFVKVKLGGRCDGADCVVDTLFDLLHRNDFRIPGSVSHRMACLMLRADMR